MNEIQETNEFFTESEIGLFLLTYLAPRFHPLCPPTLSTSFPFIFFPQECDDRFYKIDVDTMSTADNSYRANVCLLGLQVFLYFFLLFSPLIFFRCTHRLKYKISRMMSFLSCCTTKAVPENDEGKPYQNYHLRQTHKKPQ